MTGAIVLPAPASTGGGVANAVNWRGAWAPSTAYALNDEVLFYGVFYICTLAHTSSSTSLFSDGAGTWTVTTSPLIAPPPLGGSNDDYPNLAGTIALALTSNRPVVLLAGVYHVSQGLPDITTNGIRVLGQGSQRTGIQALAGSPASNFPKGILNFSGAVENGAFDLFLDGNSIAFNELSMLHTEGTVRHVFERVRLLNKSVGPAWWNVGCEDVSAWKCEIVGSEASPGTLPVGMFSSTPSGQVNFHGCDFFAPLFLTALDCSFFGGNLGTLVAVNPTGSVNRHIAAYGSWIYDGGTPFLFAPVDAAVANIDGAMTAASGALSSAAGVFTSADVGKTIWVFGAGAAGAPLVSTIASFSSATSVTLTDAASTTVSGSFYWYPGTYIANTDLDSCHAIIASSANWVNGTLPSGSQLRIVQSTLVVTPANLNNTVDVFLTASGTSNTKMMLDGIVFSSNSAITVRLRSGGSSTHTDELRGQLYTGNVTLIGQSNQVTAPSVPASGTPLVSPYGAPMYVTVTGGVVSAIVVNGTTLGITSGTFLLPPGGIVTLTYTSAPSWAWSQLITVPAVASGQYLCPPTSYAPATPANLTTASATLAAVSSSLVNTGSFTAPPSGSVLVTASFVPSATASQVWAFALAAHGTVTPVIGNVVLGLGNSTAQNNPTSIQFLVTGLTPGTSYNFDLLFAIAGGGTLAVRANGQTSTTPTGATNAPNGPVVMTVQAV